MARIGDHAVLTLFTLDGNVSYGILGPMGSGAAINSLRMACGPKAGSAAARVEAPERVV
jgi:hypothetical protein